jgi:hypothetical protein
VLQDAGNEAFAAGAFSQALAHYSRALREQPQNAVLLSNRAACYLAMKWQEPVRHLVVMDSEGLTLKSESQRICALIHLLLDIWQGSLMALLVQDRCVPTVLKCVELMAH